jgi:hypothetical protein
MSTRNDARAYMSVDEFWRTARERGAPISRGVAYDAIRRGLLPHVRLGRRIVVPADALDRLLAARSFPETKKDNRHVA